MNLEEQHIRKSQRWNQVFWKEKVTSQNMFDFYKNIYKEVNEEQYKTIDECVKYAIKTQNHIAFVRIWSIIIYRNLDQTI